MNTFETNIISLYGLQGKVWLESLPVITKDIATKFDLSELVPVSNLSYNYVMSGLKDNQPIILKLGLDIEGLKREAHAVGDFANMLDLYQLSAKRLRRRSSLM